MNIMLERKAQKRLEWMDIVKALMGIGQPALAREIYEDHCKTSGIWNNAPLFEIMYEKIHVYSHRVYAFHGKLPCDIFAATYKATVHVSLRILLS